MTEKKGDLIEEKHPIPEEIESKPKNRLGIQTQFKHFLTIEKKNPQDNSNQ